MKTYNHIYVLEDKVMKNNITEVVFILDRSGSMGGLESDTIGGFNSTLKKQKELDGKCLITTVLFDDQYEIIHDRVDAREAKEIISFAVVPPLLTLSANQFAILRRFISIRAPRIFPSIRCSSSQPTVWRMPAGSIPPIRSEK